MAMHGAINHFTNNHVGDDHLGFSNKTTTDEQLLLLLQQRQQLLALYSSVANIYPGKKEIQAVVNVVERSKLCQLLVDYLAHGQLQVFAALEDHDQSGEITSVLNQMSITTNSILDFADKYATSTAAGGFREDLSVLGENIAAHLELEDRIIDFYETIQLAA